MSVENPNEQDQIDTGMRIEMFVKDPAVQSAIARIATENYKAFKEATSKDEILMAHARGIVLDQFIDSLQGIVDTGAGARIQRNEREKRELQATAAKNRVKSV